MAITPQNSFLPCGVHHSHYEGISCFESQNMALKVVDDHCLLVGRIIFGILYLVDKMGSGLCIELDKKVDHKVL